MTTPTSQVTFGGVSISGYCTLGAGGLSVSYDRAPAGQADLDMSDGTLVRQVFFTKWAITVTGAGTVPPALRALDLTTTKSLTVPDAEEGGGTKTYTVWGTLQESGSSSPRW